MAAFRRPSAKINMPPAQRRGIAGDEGGEVGANFCSRRGRTVAVQVDGEVELHASEVVLACCTRKLGELFRERSAHLEEKRVERFHRTDRDRVRLAQETPDRQSIGRLAQWGKIFCEATKK